MTLWLFVGCGPGFVSGANTEGGNANSMSSGGVLMLAYTPVAPCRIVDTRKGGGMIDASTSRDYHVHGSGGTIGAQGGAAAGCLSPLGEPLAVHINMSAVSPAGRGNLQAYPKGAAPGAGLIVNYNAIGTHLTNAGTVKTNPGSGPDITIFSQASSAHTVIDVLGYYYPNGDLAYSPITPCRIADTRKEGGMIDASTSRDYNVYGSGGTINAQGGTAAGCPTPLEEPLAVHINVSAVSPTGRGNLQTYPKGAGPGTGLSINYDVIGTHLSNAGTVTTNPGSGPDITVFSQASSVHAVVDILGYYHPHGYLMYSPVTPCRIVDTRKQGGMINASTSRDYHVHGSGGTIGAQGGAAAGCLSPLGEPLAVHINMSAVSPAGRGNLQAYPTGDRPGAGLIINYNAIGTHLANAGTVKTNPVSGPDITVFSQASSAHTVIDVLGYYYHATPECTEGNCVGGDGCCPEGCTAETDDDCQSLLPPVQWRASLDTGSTDAAGNVLGGTEIRSLATFDGKLFAANGYWTDTGGNPGAQVLVLDRPESEGGRWRQELRLPRKPLVVGTMKTVTLATDADGTPLAAPERLLLAGGGWGEMTARTSVRRVSGAWTESTIAPRSSCSQGVRSFGVHRDSATGVDMVFAGLSSQCAPRIFSGVYDESKPSRIRWLGQEAWADPPGAHDRVTSFAETNGELYATVCGKVFKRTDGPSPIWRLAYQHPNDYCPSGPGEIGYRGATTLPTGDMIAVLEKYGSVTRLSPNGDTLDAAIELDGRAFLRNQWGLSWVGYIIMGYDGMLPVTLPGSGKRALLMGLVAKVSGINWHSWERGAWFLARFDDGTYELAEIVDPTITPKPALVSTRTLVMSPFASEAGTVIYAGGFDGNGVYGINHNSAWLYRGELR
ncbi:hypothetical protein ACFL6C_05935 [Myxococcota bacterium]